MKKSHRYQLQITASNCDSADKMGVHHMLGAFQDIATAHSIVLGIDGGTLGRESNVFWAILKTKLKIYSTPRFLDYINIETWPNTPGSIRCERNYRITSTDGKSLVEGRSEWVMLDCDKRTVRKVSSTAYDTTMEHISDVLCPEPFSRRSEKVEDEHLIYTHLARSSDIDTSQHVNNVVYARLILDTFERSFFRENDIYEFEIAYQHECREGEMINVYKKEIDTGWYFETRADDGRIFANAFMTIK